MSGGAPLQSTTAPIYPAPFDLDPRLAIHSASITKGRRDLRRDLGGSRRISLMGTRSVSCWAFLYSRGVEVRTVTANLWGLDVAEHMQTVGCMPTHRNDTGWYSAATFFTRRPYITIRSTTILWWRADGARCANSGRACHEVSIVYKIDGQMANNSDKDDQMCLRRGRSSRTGHQR